MDRSNRNRQTELEFGGMESPRLPQLLTPDQIFERAETLLPMLKEDRRIERKPAGIHQALLANYFSMWSNTSPDGGIIAVGVADDGKWRGCSSIDQSALNKLDQVTIDHCRHARYKLRNVPFVRDDGKPDFIVLIRVFYHPTKVIETNEGKVFVRLGDSCKEYKSDEERRQLRIDKGEVQYEQEPCNLPYPADFDLEAVRNLTKRVRENLGLTKDFTDTKILELLRLGKRKADGFEPNLACAILLARDPVPLVPGCKIRFLRFDGVTESTGTNWNAVKDELVSGTVPYLIDETAKLIDAQIRKISVLGKNNKFNTQLEYPREAWLEALVNACVHRSYNYANMNIFIKMFDDRMVIESPGPFPPGVTPETIYDIQHSRNPFLVGAMYHLGFAKGVNEGVNRIRNEMATLDLPAPEFAQVESGSAKVRVILKNNIANRRVWVATDVVAMIGATIAKQLTENELMVVNFVRLHQRINVNDCTRITRHNWPTAKKLLRAMEAKGVLEYVRRPGADVDRKAYWKLRGS